MKKTALILVIAMLLCSAGCAGSGSAREEPRPGHVSSADAVYPEKMTLNAHGSVGSEVLKIRRATSVEQSFIDAFNAFSYDSAKRLLTGDKNSCYSPASLYFALAACAAGASGETQKEMLDALGVKDIEELCEGCRTLFKRIWIDSDSTQVKMTNALFVDDGFSGLKESYAERVTNDFYASLRTVDFSKTAKTKEIISKYISDNTAGKLEYRGEVDPETEVSIINTLYFISRWIDPFEKSNTKKEVFHSPDGDVQCDMMYKCFRSSYYKGDGFVRIQLRFDCYDTMAFILPDEGRMDDVLAMGAEAFTGGELLNAEVHLYLPRFKIKSDLSGLMDILKEMNVKRAFDPLNAEFTEMVDLTPDMPLFYVSKVFQATYISVDEEGAEAAAYTEVGMTGGTSAPPPEPVIIRFDRPFLYAIMTSDVPLFTGVVAKPPAK